MRFCVVVFLIFFFQAEDGIRDLVRSRGLGDVYKRQVDAEHRVLLALVQVERPRLLAVGGSGQRQRDAALQPVEPSGDQRPVGPRARTGGGQAVAAGLDRPPLGAVTGDAGGDVVGVCLLYTSPSPRDRTRSRMPSSA